MQEERGPMWYEIRVKGHLHQRWSAWLYDFSLRHEADGTTTLTGDLADDAAVYGLLSKLRDMGLTLLSVKVLDEATAAQEPGMPG